MSIRLQVMMPEGEFKALRQAAKRRRCTVAALVRDGLREVVITPPARSPQERISAVLRYAKSEGPSGDIEQILSEIESGRAN